MSETKILGLIPARGGSKGIHKKNLYPFKNKPLIQWTLEAARESNLIDKIIVSTDDESIAKFSKENGAEVPYLRKKSLSQDDSLIIETVLETIEIFNNFEFILLLQPTSPLRTKNDIENVINLQKQYLADSIVSVRQATENPTLFYDIDEKDHLKKSFPNLLGNNRQSFKEFYILNGAIYMASAKHLKRYKSFFYEKTLPYIMPLERSLDIDTLLDIKWGEFILNNKKIEN